MKLAGKLSLLIIVIISFISCGNNNSQNKQNTTIIETSNNISTSTEIEENITPEAVTKSFFLAMMRFNFDEAIKYASKETIIKLNEARTMIESTDKKDIEKMKDAIKLNKIEVISSEISEDGNSATVQIKISVQDKENIMPVSLTKEDGKWKVFENQ